MFATISISSPSSPRQCYLSIPAAPKQDTAPVSNDMTHCHSPSGQPEHGTAHILPVNGYLVATGLVTARLAGISALILFRSAVSFLKAFLQGSNKGLMANPRETAKESCYAVPAWLCSLCQTNVTSPACNSSCATSAWHSSWLAYSKSWVRLIPGHRMQGSSQPLFLAPAAPFAAAAEHSTV